VPKWISATDFLSRQAGKIWVRMAHPMALESNKPVIAIYPGSFDPVTNGHLDLIARGTMIFDKLIVAVAHNLEKDPLFAVKERIELLEAVTFDWKNVEVDVFDGLLMDYARSKNARVVVRGIRAVSDYEYELQMAMMNRHIEPLVETVFMLPAQQYSYLSSRLVKELARLGGNIKDLVPPMVEERLRAKVS
jgi:pantetheine-phosphate adenylyltransferase